MSGVAPAPTRPPADGVTCLMLIRRTLLVLSLWIPCAAVLAEEWPGWRGPRGDGTSAETGLPTRWGPGENVAWSVPIPGKGHSSPAVWGDRIFVTTCIENEEKRDLLCLDRRTGKLLWQKTVLTSPLEKKHKLNSFSSSTPATDGKFVWVSFLETVPGIKPTPRAVVVCYDFDGHEVWRVSPGEFHSVHGFCSPPILYKDLVILNGDQDAPAYIVALDQKTGKEVWRADRPNKTRSYCPPLIIEHRGQKQLVLSGSKCVAGYDPDSGKQLWIIDGPTEQFVASLVYRDGLLFLTAGFPTYHTMAIDPSGRGNVTDTHVVWHHKGSGKDTSYVPSPVAYDRYFFLVSDTGTASCFDAKSGERLWMEKLGQHHSASPIEANGLLYFPDDEGTTWVLKAGPKFEVVARNALGEECYASPAVSRGQIFLRTLDHLWCIGQPGK